MYIPWVILGIGALIVWWMIERRDARIKQLEDKVRDLNSSLEQALDRNDRTPERSRESTDQEELNLQFERQQREEKMIEAAHQNSRYKHIFGLPWGDPSSYVTTEQLAEQERQLREGERQEQEARESLKLEAERVLKEREEGT